MTLFVSGDADLAQDIFQHLCVVAMERPPTKPLNLRAWAFCVAWRRVISLRRDKRLLFTPEIDRVQAGDDDPLHSASIGEAREAIIEGVLALPEYLRLPTMLRYWKGLSRGEVAAVMGIDPRALDYLLSKARSRLRLKCARQRLAWH